MRVLLATLLVAVFGVQAPDVTGTWDGTLSAAREDGSRSEDRALLILAQKGSVITGTLGSSEDDQHPITKGSIDGKKVVLDATHSRSGREYHLELTVEGDELTGTVTSGDRKGDVRAKKRRE